VARRLASSREVQLVCNGVVLFRKFLAVPKVKGRRVSKCLGAGVDSVEVSERGLVLSTDIGNR